MSRPINFCSGPAALPLPVVDRIQRELPDFRGSKISVMEHSHRDKLIVELFEETASRLKSLLGIDDSYQVLFLPGGATLQFSQIPMNLLGADQTAAYLTTGAWSQKAIKEAMKYGQVTEAGSSKESNFTTIPAKDTWHIPPDSKYFHICTNETIHGVEWFGSLNDIGVPVVADMSSHLLSRSMPVHEFDLIYAGAQKNLGTAGVTIVVIKPELLGQSNAQIPSLMEYQNQIANDSMVNTPPVHAVWVLSLVLEWLESLGGVAAIERMNETKAHALYEVIDHSTLYSNPVATQYRSRMNVPFVLADESLDKRFIESSNHAGLLNLKGHRSVGGMRASIYNAITQDDVETLIEFMREFERVAA